MNVALVLAAGVGSRVGGPKALLLVEGLPLAALHAQRRLSREADRVVLVVRRDVAALLAPLLPDRVRVVVSEEDDALGPAGSLRAALRADAFGGDDHLLVTPVDVMPATARVARTLLAGLEDHDAARPERGHPIALRGRVLDAGFLASPEPLRAVLARLGDRCATATGLVGERDLDTVDDVVRLTGAPPTFFSPSPRSEGTA
ncbi:MAG: NTP transferase domain-containing protein [Myxococcales bacterium]|nr:NTP transferase domain-containing protein [Myxococcales bacterium]